MVKDIKDKFELVTRNLQEVIGEDELKEKLKSKKDFSIYWGTMPTGSVSIAYFFPMLKVADFLKAGCKVKILLADLHAILDGVPFDLVEKKYKYYEEAILLILKTIGVDPKKLEFVKGSELQLDKKYFNDLLKLSTMTTIRNSTKAASEAVKTAQGEKSEQAIQNPKSKIQNQNSFLLHGMCNLCCFRVYFRSRQRHVR